MAATQIISKKDVEILSHLRNDARKKITKISRSIEIPVTTIYDKVKAHEKKGIIKKNVALLDYTKLGFSTTALIAMKVVSGQRNKLQEFLQEHQNVNSLYRVNFEHDFLAECIFEDGGKLQEFLDETENRFGVQELHIFNIVHEIKKENFLTNPEHMNGENNIIEGDMR